MLFERAEFTFAGVNILAAIVFGIVSAIYASHTDTDPLRNVDVSGTTQAWTNLARSLDEWPTNMFQIVTNSPFASARLSLLNYVSFEDGSNYLTLSWDGRSFYDWAGFSSASNFVIEISFEPRVIKTNGAWTIEFKP